VKKKNADQALMNRTYTYTIKAVVYPFEMNLNLINAASNLISNREEPIPLQIEVPVPKNWTMEFHESLEADPRSMAGGWNFVYDAKIPFSLDDKSANFSGQGPGTFGYELSASAAGGLVKCTAPASKFPFSMSLQGRIVNSDTMNTHFDLKDTPPSSVAMSITCKGMGITLKTNPIQGGASGSVVAGTPAQSFDVILEDGATKSFPTTYGDAHGTARITFHAQGAE
jgi:hypothetical protein